MSTLYNHKEYKRLRQLIVIAAGCYGCDVKSINGVKDTLEKIMVLYLVKKDFDMKDDELYAYFNINRYYMQQKLQELTVTLLVNDAYKNLVMNPLKVLLHLEVIDIVNG